MWLGDKTFQAFLQMGRVKGQLCNSASDKKGAPSSLPYLSQKENLMLHHQEMAGL